MRITSDLKRSWLSLIVFLAITFAVAAAGGVAASSARSTYQALELPFFAPPGWVFGPVWTVLYAMIGVAGWMLWHSHGGRGRPLVLWAIQLVLNLIWTPLFFGGDLYGIALLEILLLLGALTLTIRASWPVSRPAALMLVPYLAWVAFATALNASVWWLN